MSRSGDAATHRLGVTKRGDLVLASVQDGGWHMDLAKAVDAVVGTRCLLAAGKRRSAAADTCLGRPGPQSTLEHLHARHGAVEPRRRRWCSPGRAARHDPGARAPGPARSSRPSRSRAPSRAIMPTASMSASVSSAIIGIVYGASGLSVRPAPRLSKASTWWVCAHQSVSHPHWEMSCASPPIRTSGSPDPCSS